MTSDMASRGVIVAREYIVKSDSGSEIRYTDGKRWLFIGSLLLPLIPALSVLLYFAGLGLAATTIPAIFFFLITPVADMIIGEDTNNPPEEFVAAMSADRYYSWLVRLAVPIAWLSFIAVVMLVGTQDLPTWSWIILLLGAALINGNCITIGHELGHKQDKTDQRFALWSNAVVGYAHFRTEHNRGHHIWVSTPEDPASARMGESIYRFVMREIPGTLVRGWQLEAERLSKKGLSLFSPQNEMLQGWAITIGAATILVMLLGPKILPFILLHHLLGWYALTQANYVEHYGLLRQKRENGHYEPCRPHHSWNTNHIFSNLLSFHLQRHSDHHTNPMRPYQALRDFPDLPRLPSGYPGMFLLAAVPPLFFRVMDPKVMAWAKGDISKVNMAPFAKERLERRWSNIHSEPAQA
jgi:alkane 1-monooxygenase